MSVLMRWSSAGLLALVAASSRVQAQTLPADTGVTTPGIGFSLPRVGGTLSYALSASELIANGFYNNAGTTLSTDLSGDVAYVSKSQSHPFSAVYDGGVLFANSGQPTTVFQSLSMSQVFTTRRWNVSLADTVSYLPDSPFGGLSGVAGVGDLGVDPIVTGPTTGSGILTSYGPRVSNTASGTVTRQITGHVSAQVTGVYSLQRFIGDNSGLALDSTDVGGSGGVTYRFSARDSLTGNYNYSNFSYSTYHYGFSTQGATVEYSRQWTPRFTTDVYAGPQIISGSSLATQGSHAEIAAGANASYASRSTTYVLSYSRGVNNGSGVIAGSFSDSLTGAAHRRIGRTWSLSGDVGYARSTSLPGTQLGAFQSDGVTVSGQLTKSFARYFSAFGSYSIEDQSTVIPSSSPVANNAFSGFYQVVSLGISYSPRSLLLGR